MTGLRLLRAWTTALALSLCMAANAPAQAQDAPPIPTELSSLEGRPSPRGAMLRSFALPGWGQASYDRYFRGGVYFMGHGGNAYMVLKTIARLGEARDMARRREDAVEARLVAEGHAADSIPDLVAADPAVRRIRGLVSAREEQREDWIALGLFWVLVSGIDAYVTAQLADFPATIGATTDGRTLGIFVSVPVR
jgi:hypothetical protein